MEIQSETCNNNNKLLDSESRPLYTNKQRREDKRLPQIPDDGNKKLLINTESNLKEASNEQSTKASRSKGVEAAKETYLHAKGNTEYRQITKRSQKINAAATYPANFTTENVNGNANQVLVSLPTKSVRSKTLPGKINEASLGSNLDARRISSTGAFVIQVESGLLGAIPPNLQVTETRNPCAVFAVVETSSKQVVWRFIKEYEQLRNFHDLLTSILSPLIKNSLVHLSPFPYKSQRENLFSTANVQPWHVDVRNDMLNAYFKTVSELNSNSAVQRNAKIRREVERAIAALWLHNVVDVPPQPISSNSDWDEMSGFLMSRKNCKSRWETHFCTINGAFLDIQKSFGDCFVTRSIPLQGAHIQLKITFFDLTETDERYAFTIYQTNKNTKEYILHSFTAENALKQHKWITKLRHRITRIASGEIGKESRFYNADELPVPYISRESPHRTQFLNSGNKPPVALRNGEFKNSTESLPTISKPKLIINNNNNNNNNNNKAPVDKKTMREFNVSKLNEELAALAIYEDLSSDSNESMSFFDKQDYEYTTEPCWHKQYDYPDAFSEYLTVMPNLAKEPGHADDEIESAKPNRPSLKRTGSSNYKKNRYNSSSGPPGKANCRNPCKASPAKAGKVFGIMPQDCKYLVSSISGDSIPTVVSRCIDRFNQPGAIEEIGIFRTSGTQTQIDELQEEFDTKGDFDIVKAKIDVHTSADLLKRYLRTLPRCLFGQWDEPKARSVLKLQEDILLEVLRIEIGEVKGVNKSVIYTILSVLWRTSQKENQNSMSLRNLGVALSPALRVPGPVLELFIKYYQSIF